MFSSINQIARVLVFNGELGPRSLLLNILARDYDCDYAETLESTLRKVREQHFSVIICDYVRAQKEDVELLSYVNLNSPNTVVVFTGPMKGAEEIIDIFRSGAVDYLPEPFDLSQVENVIKRAVGQYELNSIRDHYRSHLEDIVVDRTMELNKAMQEVEASYRMALKALVQALETRDFETHGHSERVVTFSLRLGQELGLDGDDLKNLELGALLHDIGKIGVPDAILRKPAKLTDEEWQKMRLHPVHGQKILRHIPFLEGAATVVAQHHEKWDGSGYPTGLRGEEIVIGARVFAVIDAFDAMTSDRVYRLGTTYEESVIELDKFAGTQFDPHIVEIFKQIPKEDWENLRRHSLREKPEVLSFQAIVTDAVATNSQMEMVH
jgi:response regulator RpfG family c-di-GMP phosphodiesterase